VNAQTTILPPNASRLERAVDHAAAARFDALPVPVDDVWNPETCPADLLPWLAWSVSIDLWDSAWTEAVKRDAIAGAIPEQRRKGTKLSVRRALDRIDPAIGLTEWFEDRDNLEPFTFRLDLPEQGASLIEYNAATIARLLRDIEAVKPLRAHVIASYRIYAQAYLGIVSAIIFGGLARVEAEADLTIADDPVWATYLLTEDGEPLQTEAGEFLEAE
jgi:phage tail P2-like protein